METNKRYSIRELSALTDLSPRTIRYYIQEGLVDKPEGQFKGAYYTDRHLKQLVTIRKYKESGVSLERIAQILHEESEDDLPRLVIRPGRVEVLSRIYLADGLELTVSPERTGLSQTELRHLAKEIATLVETIKRKNDVSDKKRDEYDE
jgi:DNA-binding transcriptional MerR regulator